MVLRVRPGIHPCWTFFPAAHPDNFLRLLMVHDLEQRIDIASEAAWEAGKATLRWFQASPEVEWKKDRTPVTAADRESERILTAILSREFPGHAFLGEETGARPGSSGWRWIVDPLDGTKSFIQGVPLYGVLVGLEDPGGDLVGGVACPPRWESSSRHSAATAAA